MNIRSNYPASRRRRPSAARGFTLVELTVALFLAVFMMVGVAEIFKMSANTAKQVEAAGDSYQMARGALNLITQDISQAAPDGYFYIMPQNMRVNLPTVYNSLPTNHHLYAPVPSYNKPYPLTHYRFDTLYFTAVGRFRQLGEVASNPKIAPGAQIFYGPGLRQAGSGNVGFRAGIDSDPPNSDQRGALLIRKTYLISGTPDPMSSATAPLIRSIPAVSNSIFAQMAVESIHTTLPQHRIKPVMVGIDGGSESDFQPVDVVGSAAGYDPNIDFMVADRVSEFIVEVWGYDTAGGKMGWIRPKIDIPRDPPDKPDTNYIWTLGAENVKLLGVPTMPEMIRVTMVLHPHNDQEPLQPFTHYSKKFVGDVFRRIIRLPGPVVRANPEVTTSGSDG